MTRRGAVGDGNGVYLVRLTADGQRSDSCFRRFAEGWRYGVRDFLAPGGALVFIRGSGSFPFIASWPAATDTFHVYQLRKYAADSAVILVDGERLGAVDYDDLSATPSPASSTRFQFGSPRVSGASNSDWDYVIFEIGVPTP
jgi:hypothetical protein